MGVQGSAAEQLQNSYIGETCANDDKLPTGPTADNQKMPIYDLFSKRQRVLEGKVPDVYSYDEIPQQLRMQILHILGDALGHETDDPYYDPSMGPYRHIHDVLCRARPTSFGPRCLAEHGHCREQNKAVHRDRNDFTSIGCCGNL